MENKYNKKQAFLGTIISRINTIASIEGISISDMEKKIGASKGVLSRAIKNGTDIQAKWLEKIIQIFPNHSADWLLTGCGEPSSLIVRENYPEYGEEYYPSALTNGTPYFDVDFLGGFDEVFNDQTTTPSYYINFKAFGSADLWCNVSGRSMEPLIHNGDIIALKECRVEDIQYGEIYATVLDSIRTVKMIRKHKDATKLRFVPVNIEEYDEEEYNKCDIIKIYKVIGSISKLF